MDERVEDPGAVEDGVEEREVGGDDQRHVATTCSPRDRPGGDGGARADSPRRR